MVKSKPKVLFVYSDRECSCAFKRCFEIVNGLHRYHSSEIDASAVYYTLLKEEHFRKYDSILFQRLGANAGVISESFRVQLERWITKYRSSCYFIYDIDDLFLHAQNNTPLWFCSLSDVVLVPNEYLAKEISPIKKCHIIKTHVDIDICEMMPASILYPKEKVHIGWFSIAANGLEIMNAVMQSIFKKFHDRIMFHLYCYDPFHNLVKSEISCANFHLHSLVSGFQMYQLMKSMYCIINPIATHQQFSVAMGMNEESLGRFLQCKSEIKYAIAGACRVPLVVSPVGVYSSVIKHKTNGLLADTKEQWIEVLSEIIEDDSLRYPIIENAYEDVQRQYSLQRACRDYLEFFQSKVFSARD